MARRLKLAGGRVQLDRRWAFAAGAALLAVFLLANQGARGLVSSWWTLRGLRRQLAASTKEEGRLQDRIAAAKGDDSALEREARVELGFQRPGEIEYRFPPPKKPGS
ncbi:MAG: septum formation initiator family protein [Elusimicrobia bacterium]|nr:septum formation initiator family protein [Elusimicrobiota bacterium]